MGTILTILHWCMPEKRRLGILAIIYTILGGLASILFNACCLSVTKERLSQEEEI